MSENINKFEELLERSGITPDEVENVNRMNVWQMGSKDEEGNVVVTDLVGMRVRPKLDLTEYSPAVAANITPNDREPITRPYHSLFVLSDAQIDYRRINGELMPTHDERAMAVAQGLCEMILPDEIINLGDTVDLASLSRFKPDSDHFQSTLAPAFQRVHDFYAQLRADNPNAKITEVDSNHNTRLRDFVLKNMPQLYNVQQAESEDEYPVLTYPFLANFKPLDINWVSGYGAAEYHYSKDLIFRHGNTAVSTGSTAAKVSKQEPEVNVVQGHAHRAETYHRTTRAGKYLASIVVGALCDTTGKVPSYNSAVNDRNQPVRHQEDWVQSVMEIQDYGDSNYLFNHIPIRNGRAFYQGQEFTA